jgi:SAM-dependent methyltransferase
MNFPAPSILTNIQFQEYPGEKELLFEKKYILIRTLENRLITDEELMRLPEIASNHRYYGEWLMRKSSIQRLIRRLSAPGKPLEILEVGCGNGWLSHRLAEIPGSKVTGLDINLTELQQAARVFRNVPNLRWVQGDIRSGILGNHRYDRIIFAASVQYFPFLKEILYTALANLSPDGEIHILDTPFYKTGELEKARGRTLTYYTSFGYPEMADLYYHHTIDELRSFRPVFLYNPQSFRNRLQRIKSPFPWIRIKHIKF